MQTHSASANVRPLIPLRHDLCPMAHQTRPRGHCSGLSTSAGYRDVKVAMGKDCQSQRTHDVHKLARRSPSALRPKLGSPTGDFCGWVLTWRPPTTLGIRQVFASHRLSSIRLSSIVSYPSMSGPTGPTSPARGPSGLLLPPCASRTPATLPGPTRLGMTPVPPILACARKSAASDTSSPHHP